jgi:hypothetical protein
LQGVMKTSQPTTSNEGANLNQNLGGSGEAAMK